METENGAGQDVVTGSEEVQETAANTDTVQTTEQTPDVDRLLEDIEANWEKIPAEKRARLDKHFQPAFNRKLNLLNQQLDTSVRNALADTGVSLPEGKSPLDLLTENDGKGFGDFLRGVVAKEFEPVKAKITEAEKQQVLQNAIASAVKDNPVIKDYVDPAIRTIDGDSDLTTLAMQGNGRGLYYVLQGVGYMHAHEKAQAEIQRLTKLLEANKIAVKTAGGTTRAGAQTPKAQQPTLKGMKFSDALKKASAMALERVKAEEAEA